MSQTFVTREEFERYKKEQEKKSLSNASKVKAKI